jgi:dipeptidyl aminopeptidase/acylaminoacyl peptidase
MGNSWSRHARALVLLVLVVGVVGGSATASTSSSTAFPGANGLIAFNSEGAVYVVNPDGTGLRRLAQTNSSDYTTGVSWSADGRLLAFSAYRGSDPDIYIVQANGKRLHQVTFSRGIDIDPSWSPDGKHIAFETNRNGNVDIYSIDSTGRNAKRLTTGAENEQDPAWSPDGTRIAYTVEATDGSTREVWVMNADGTNQTQLTSTPNFSENPNWSPDGSRIAFDSDRLEKGDLDVYSMRADGSDVKRLTTTPALDALPAYSPDGKKIVFVSDRIQKDSRRLFVLPAAGGRARRLIAGDDPGFQMVPDWQRIRPGTKEKPAVPPGAPLGSNGAADRVDPLYDPDDAWSVAMTAGVTYRFNLQPRGGCASAALYAPGTRAFAGARTLVYRACGGYFTYTPGPGRDGTYTVLVSARPGTEAIVAYRLGAAPAQPDDQGPGIAVENGADVSGSVSSRGLDVVDLYHFDVTDRSIVRIGLESGGRLSLALETLSGKTLDRAVGGSGLVETLAPGTYLIAVSAPARASGSYRLSLLERVVTQTTLKIGTAKSVTIPLGQPVVLQSATTPAPAGGHVALRLDYEDPLAGWVFRQLWTVAPQGSVTFTPPAVGVWRVDAGFSGTRTSSPSRSDYVTINVRSPR